MGSINDRPTQIKICSDHFVGGSTMFALLCVALISSTFGQLVPSQYVEFLPGTLNVILTSAHGGDLLPSSIPDRDAGCWISGACVYDHNCGTKDFTQCDVSTNKDLFTAEQTRELRDALFAEFGAYPTVVINLLNRIKLDSNREVNQATFNVPEAVEAWNYYHGLVAEAKANQTTQALLIDIHGHTHPNDWAELGYLVTGANLDTGNYTAADTSVNSLFTRTTGVATIQELITAPAPVSFGGILEASGFWSVPSPRSPSPNGETYVTGGYTTENYGSRDGGIVDSIHIESPLIFREAQRPQYVAAITQAIRDYFTRHHA